jgi:hypothetical protein
MTFVISRNQFAIGINENFCFYWFICGSKFQAAIRFKPFIIGVYSWGIGWGLLND